MVGAGEWELGDMDLGRLRRRVVGDGGGEVADVEWGGGDGDCEGESLDELIG